MSFKEYTERNFVFFDGAFGTMLQKLGMKPGEHTEVWNLTHKDEVKKVHEQYLKAGCNVITTNTFGANPLKYDHDTLREMITSAVDSARQAANAYQNERHVFVALDIGPTGRMLKPYGDLDFEDAVQSFAECVRIGVENGVDLIIIETMTDLYETKAALLAAKENSSLPVVVSNAYSEDGKLMTGSAPGAVIALLEGMHADAIGVNCSFGADKLMPVVKEYLRLSSTPVIVMPNAGLPVMENGKSVYTETTDEFAQKMAVFAQMGVNILGGCCGTTPEHIEKMISLVQKQQFSAPKRKHVPVISSVQKTVYPSVNAPFIIGERINPTGKKRMKTALLERDLSYILGMAVEQQEAGSTILDVNAGMPGIDEKEILPLLISEIQSITTLPLQIDSSDPVALENALRVYNGKAMINSVNGKQECMDSVFPLAAKYGGMLVALTLDENGIPQTVEGRMEIAQKIIRNAEKWGIDKRDIVFDPLTMAVSASENAAVTTLGTLKRLHEQGLFTVLGISNVSFGLPGRETLNAVFFTCAMENGLTFGIVNPCNKEIMKAYRVFRALHAKDPQCMEYIRFNTENESVPSVVPASGSQNRAFSLQDAIYLGMKADSAAITETMLQDEKALSIINGQIIPALDAVGRDYEAKKIYLPQLLMSA